MSQTRLSRIAASRLLTGMLVAASWACGGTAAGTAVPVAPVDVPTLGAPATDPRSGAPSPTGQPETELADATPPPVASGVAEVDSSDVTDPPEPPWTLSPSSLEQLPVAGLAPLTMTEATNPHLSVEERRLMAYQAQLENDRVGAEGYFESLRYAGELDAEASVRYAWLLNEDSRYDAAREVLEPHRTHPAVRRLYASTAAWADGRPDPSAPTAAPSTNPSMIPGLTFVIEDKAGPGGRVTLEARGLPIPDPESEPIPPPATPTELIGRRADYLRGVQVANASADRTSRLPLFAPLTVAPLEVRVGEAEAHWKAGRHGTAASLADRNDLRGTTDIDPVVAARVARVNDRSLEAQRALKYSLADSQGEEERGEDWLLLAEVAESRGDYRTARSSLAAAEASGADPVALEATSRRVDRALGPIVRSGASGMQNGADVQVGEAWAAGTFRPGGHFRLVGGVSRIQLTQGGTIRQSTIPSLAADSLFAIDAARVSGGAYVSFEDLGPVLPAGFVTFDLELGSGTTFFARFSHDPAWNASYGVDPLARLRLRSLATLDPNLLATDYRIGASFNLGLQSYLSVGAGGTAYNDGHQRSLAHAQWCLPLLKNRFRLSFEPNGYVEISSGQPDGLLVPSGYLQLGSRVRTRFALGALQFNLSANPHFFDYPEADGFGVTAEGETTLELGRLDLILSGAYLDQQIQSYSTIGLGLGVPIG